MSAFLIGYDLDKPDQDYATLEFYIRTFETHWHQLDSTWIVITDKGAEYILNKLKPHIGSSTKLLVAELSGQFAHDGFDVSSSKWLSTNIGT